MNYEKFRALQWSTSGTETKKVLRNLDKHLSGIDVVTLQELQGTNIYDNQAKDIAGKLGFNHKFLPSSDTPNNGVAILSPHELWFPEQYEVPGLSEA
jgi:exonuclease III